MVDRTQPATAAASLADAATQRQQVHVTAPAAPSDGLGRDSTMAASSGSAAGKHSSLQPSVQHDRKAPAASGGSKQLASRPTASQRTHLRTTPHSSAASSHGMLPMLLSAAATVVAGGLGLWLLKGRGSSNAGASAVRSSRGTAGGSPSKSPAGTKTARKSSASRGKGTKGGAGASHAEPSAARGDNAAIQEETAPEEPILPDTFEPLVAQVQLLPPAPASPASPQRPLDGLVRGAGVDVDVVCFLKEKRGGSRSKSREQMLDCKCRNTSQ